jgi:amidase
MNEHNLDLMIGNSDCTLVSFTACAGRFTYLLPLMNPQEEQLMNATGWPSSTVPLGQLENGLPYGLFVIARANREDLIFRFMSSFEAMVPKIRGPTLFLSQQQ